MLRIILKLLPAGRGHQFLHGLIRLPDFKVIECREVIGERIGGVRLLEGFQPPAPFFGGRIFPERSFQSHLRITSILLHCFLQQRRITGGAIRGQEAGCVASICLEIRFNLCGAKPVGRFVFEPLKSGKRICGMRSFNRRCWRNGELHLRCGQAQGQIA